MSDYKAFVTDLFKKKKDKAGNPYIEHCKFVADMAKRIAILNGLTKYEQDFAYRVGFCHDVLEDTDTTEEELTEYIGKYATDVVKILSHDRVYNRDAYIAGVKEDPFATIVKYADAFHNSWLTRYPPEKRTVRRMKKCQEYSELCRELYFHMQLPIAWRNK